MIKEEPIIEIKHLFYRYDRENVLEDVNLSVNYGSFLGIVGPNGSGKSTLLKLILGLNKPQRGEIKLFGKDIKQFRERQKIGFVSQKANSFNSGFPATVYEVVASGLTKKIGLLRFYNKNDAAKIEKAVASVGMEKFLHRNIGELSGGQQQRVFIARALVSDPELLILDEPTVGVDAENVQSFYEMLEQLNKDGITLLMVTHDIGAITDKVTNVACLNKVLFFHGTSTEFEDKKHLGISDIYGHDVHLLTHDHKEAHS
ncbi:zinc ABC transporter ATP-binding protein [Mesobacillus campisalis]|uniref:Zinc ABC transporter ATP-binding protein n=1 Tax=Mesobacillus campisalis TaxID=1408103 RepID=A0A0M2SFW4_9BACI|nr:metal ABC transporter ATP-binding protein [Mesobacillus campisalis]KKK33173.1 zinc ABC transporter ATP-binding protein [Mesobacillus campisalis]